MPESSLSISITLVGFQANFSLTVNFGQTPRCQCLSAFYSGLEVDPLHIEIAMPGKQWKQQKNSNLTRIGLNPESV